MDDVLVLSPTRSRLRRAVRVINRHLAGAGLEKAPDKTFIGRIDKGFDFLGYHFTRAGLSVAEGTARKFVERVSRLYEQEQRSRNGGSALGDYVRRWTNWTRAGVSELSTAGGSEFIELSSPCAGCQG